MSYRAARTLDLDLILYGAEVIDAPGVTVPHPRFRERRFVLQPLASLAPDWKDPLTGKTVQELLDVLNQKGGEGIVTFGATKGRGFAPRRCSGRP